MTTHTIPGPWSYEVKLNRVVVTEDSPEYRIVTEITGARAEDDAGLIASAPPRLSY